MVLKRSSTWGVLAIVAMTATGCAVSPLVPSFLDSPTSNREDEIRLPESDVTYSDFSGTGAADVAVAKIALTEVVDQTDFQRGDEELGDVADAKFAEGPQAEVSDPEVARSQAMDVAQSGVAAAVDSNVLTPVVEATRGDFGPFSLGDDAPFEYWELPLDEAIQIALANSTVLRDLGARVVQAPALVQTIYGPPIQATDPRFGIESALSAFDAQLSADAFFENNDRVLNNRFTGGGVNFFAQDLNRFRYGITKLAATGTEFALRHNIEDDSNNSTGNLLPRAWSWNAEAEFRHPLLQGSGVRFNRIAGPGATPGVYNGVMIARVNANSSIAEFEVALRDYLSNAENAYWDLYFGYRDLDAKKKARDRSLDTWRLLETKQRQGIAGASLDQVAQAREQYFRFEQEVQNALSGRLVDGTRSFNGSGGGTLQGTGAGGVYVAERRLRLLMGMPVNDGRLIRPASEPPAAPVKYAWSELVSNAFSRRTELRIQQLNVERRNLELIASRNFVLPRFDVVGTYRVRGLGDRLYDPHVMGNNNVDRQTDTDEWTVGVQLSHPIGFRQAHSGVRNAELRLARERALLREMERQVEYGVSNAKAEVDRAYTTLRTALNRQMAAQQQYDILSNEARAQVVGFDFNRLLDSERRLAEAEIAAQRATVEYALAAKNLNVEMGTLLEYFNIQLADGPWPRRELASSQRARPLNYVLRRR